MEIVLGDVESEKQTMWGAPQREMVCCLGDTEKGCDKKSLTG